MQINSPQINQLVAHFIELDTDQDGYINEQQLANYMNSMNLHKIPTYEMIEAMQLLNNKMNQQNFVIWILGCKSQFQNLSLFKFNLQNSVKKFQSNNLSAGPTQQNFKIKKSFVQFCINKTQKQQNKENHFLKINLCLNKEKNQVKRKQIQQVLQRKPSDIFFFIKIKTQKNGLQVAQNFKSILDLGLQLAQQLGPTVTPILQNLKHVCKYYKGYVYLILQQNHTFFNHILSYMDQAIKTLSPKYDVQFNLELISNFSKVLQKNYDYLSQSMNLKAQLQIDNSTLTKLKQLMVLENFEQKSSDQKTNLMFLLLLEEIKLSSSFSNLKEFLQSLGFSEQNIPKPYDYAQQIKQFSIKQILATFLPQGDKFFNLIQQSCKPEGQMLLCLADLSVKIDFKLLLQGLFDLL